MLDWIVMDIIHVLAPILFVPDQMFPKPALPDLLLAAAGYLGVHSYGKISFYQPPSAGKISVLVRHLPDTMQMIGQHHYGVDDKRPMYTYLPKGFF